jgi:glyoxylase-like metal-dependent hydrolase (beta-lactamase superfamily II)
MSIESTFAKAGLTVFERGWLSSNNVLFKGDGPTALVDSGYATHAAQTIALVRNALGSQSLDHLLNTHLHSDHCGGNARLQAEFPAIQTWIPPGQAKAVMHWDPQALSFEPTGQICESFTFQHLLTPGSTVQLGRCEWEVHAAKGHDPHSVVLFQPELRILVLASFFQSWKAQAHSMK